jgi:hypothetical protein
MPSFNLQRLFNPVLLVLFFITWGCGSNSDKNGDAVSDTTTVAAMTEDDKLEAIMNEAMTRLRYKDKSYIYEMEFSSYREEHTFDEYLQETKIKTAQADSLEYVDVITVTYFGQDSAKATVKVHFRGPTGQETILPDQEITFYRDQDRWIKPTLSKIDAQRQYVEIKEKAKSAAKSESGGSGK